MRYKITLEEHGGVWTYVITFGKDTPSTMAEMTDYSDDHASAEDAHAVRHYVYYKEGKIVQIQLHDAQRLTPYLDPDRPETVRMPTMQGFESGHPPTPTLLLTFKAGVPGGGVGYALSPNVFLRFDHDELAHVVVSDCLASIKEMD